MIETIKEEIWNIRTLDLTRSAIGIVEKVFWILVALSGTVWFFYFMAFQVTLWNNNNIFISKAKMTLADIDYPAVTFCSPRANKFGVGERLGNYIDPNAKVTNQFLTWLRKSAIECSIDRKVSYDNLNLYRNKYKSFCKGPYDDMTSDCKVLENIKQCKADSLTMKDVYEDLVDHLSGQDVTFSTWNLGKHAKKYLTSKYNCKFNDSSSGHLDIHYFSILLYIFEADLNDKLNAFEYEEPFNWATNEIGLWIVRNIMYMKYLCFNSKGIDYETMIHDFFTMEGEDISLLDISHLFSLIDVQVLGLEVSTYAIYTLICRKICNISTKILGCRDPRYKHENQSIK